MSESPIPAKLTLTPGTSRMLDAPGHGIGGYVWTAKVDSGPGRIEEGRPEQRTDSIGAGATAKFRLTWLGSEAGRVTLALKRPWESEPIEVHHIEIEPAESDPER